MGDGGCSFRNRSVMRSMGNSSNKAVQESFRQRFEQLRFLNGSDIDDTLSHCGIVDRLGQDRRTILPIPADSPIPNRRRGVADERVPRGSRRSGRGTPIARSRHVHPCRHCRRSAFGLSSDESDGVGMESGGRLLRLDEVTTGIEFVFGIVNQPNNAAAILTGVVFLSQV